MKSILTTLVTLLLLATTSFCQNQNLSQQSFFDGEPYISINPNNSQHLVVAWLGFQPLSRIVIKTKVSFDGGNTWSNTVNLPHVVASYTSADPCMDFDANGNPFLAYIDFTGFDSFPVTGVVVLSKSTDGGLSWETPVEVISSEDDPGKRAIDRPWMAIDRSTGPNSGNIYITTMNAKGSTIGYNPYLSRSFDGGNSFETFRYLDTTNWESGLFVQQPMPTPCVTSNGTFHAAYPSYVPAQNFLAQFILASSTDGGNSLDHHTVFASSTSVSDSLAKAGYLIRSDPSDSEHLLFFYLDKGFGDIDIYMRDSYNGGLTWTNGVRVNDDPIANNRMQDLVWADLDTDGDLVVSWRDRRNTNDSTFFSDIEIMAAVRWKDSTNFSPNFSITDQLVPYDTSLSINGNDFMCIKLMNDTLSAVWGDPRTGFLNIWFQRMRLDGSMISVRNLASEPIPQITVYPTPFSNLITVEGKQLTSIQIIDLQGKLVLAFNDIPATDQWKFDLGMLPSGSYLIRATTADGTVSEQIQKR